MICLIDDFTRLNIRMNQYVYKSEEEEEEDEEDNQSLREAADFDYLPNSSIKDHSSETKSDGNKYRSNRYYHRGYEDSRSFDVPQSYKEFVAQKFFEFLERNIELVEPVDPIKIEEKKKTEEIRLLSSSTNSLVCHDEAEPACLMFTNEKIVDEDPAIIMEKCKEVAVDPELIIAKTEVESWDEKQKGTLYKYKKTSDGILIEIT